MFQNCFTDMQEKYNYSQPENKPLARQNSLSTSPSELFLLTIKRL